MLPANNLPLFVHCILSIQSLPNELELSKLPSEAALISTLPFWPQVAYMLPLGFTARSKSDLL